MSKIIDISKWQGNMNFDVIKDKVDGVMLRCSYGVTKDTKFDEYAKQANQLGIPIGAYTFANYHYDSVGKHRMIPQADKTIEILKGKNINEYVALDLELESGQSCSLSKKDMTDLANAYMDKLAQAGYRPCLYCSISWLYDRMNVSEIKYPLWIAYYHEAGFFGNSFPETKYGNLMRGIKDKIIMWQYSSKGDGKKFGASSEYIDLNHIYTEFAQKEEVQTPVAPPAEPSINTYIVQKGDTLTAIANRNGIRLSYLITANPQITNPDLIRVGQRIVIPDSNGTVTQTKVVEVGTIVKVKRNAKTYDGKNIAKFVYDNVYRVDELKGNRAVLDKKGICSPINIADLEVV